MTIGHVKLNHRPYIIDPARYTRANANEFAAKLGTGSGEYEDLEDWSAWVMDNWQAGVGLSDAVGGGLLYGEVDTRFSGQLFLPGLMYPTSGSSFGDGYGNVSEVVDIAQVLTIGESQTYKAGSKQIVSSEDIDDVWIYAKIDKGVQVQVSIYEVSALAPTTPIDSVTFTANEDTEGYYWYQAAFVSPVTPTNPSVIVVEPLGGATIDLPLSASTSPANESYFQKSSDDSWTGIDGYRIGVLSSADSLGLADTGRTVRILKYGSDYVTFSGTAVAKLATSADGYLYWSNYLSPPSTTDEMTDAIVFNGKIYIAYGDPKEAVSWTGSGAGTSLGFDVTLFAQWNNYLYAAHGNNLYYSVDGDFWAGPFEVGPPEYSITGMAGLGAEDNTLGVSTEDGLYEFKNNFAIGRAGWGSISELNGRGMVGHEGELYIPTAGNSVYRYTVGGTLLDIWIPREEELPAERLGSIRALASLNYGLVALVDAPSDGGQATCWNYNGQGWHFVASLPEGMGAGALYFDRTNSRLWIGAVGFNWYINYPDIGVNPRRYTGYNYQPYGWWETPDFFGGIRELQKDVESVYISGENITASSPIAVYWKDDDSTAWEYLGQVTSDKEELIWTDLDTRPNTKEIRLGFLLSTNSKTVTPVIRAIRLKYHLNINDRRAWSFTVLVSKGQQMLDGSINDYTADDNEAHLLALENQVPPVYFEDLDGIEYRVKVRSYSTRVTRVEVVDGELEYESEHYLTVAEI